MRGPHYCLISFILKGRIYQGTTTVTTAATTADTDIPFWQLSALEGRLEIPDFIICLIMTSYFVTDLPIHMQQRLLPPVQIPVHAEVRFASSFLELITLIIGTKSVILYTFHYHSRVDVRGWFVNACLLGSCAVHVTGLSTSAHQ